MTRFSSPQLRPDAFLPPFRALRRWTCALTAFALTLVTGLAQQNSRPNVYTLADKPESSRRNVYEALLSQKQGNRGVNTHVSIVETLGDNAYVVTSESLKEPIKMVFSPARPAYRVGASVAVTLIRIAENHDYTSPEGAKMSIQTWREVTPAESAQAGWKSYDEFLASLQAGGRESLRRPEPVRCSDCQGTGLVIRGVACRKCDGRGSVPSLQHYLVIWSREAAATARR